MQPRKPEARRFSCGRTLSPRKALWKRAERAPDVYSPEGRLQKIASVFNADSNTGGTSGALSAAEKPDAPLTGIPTPRLEKRLQLPLWRMEELAVQASSRSSRRALPELCPGPSEGSADQPQPSMWLQRAFASNVLHSRGPELTPVPQVAPHDSVCYIDPDCQEAGLSLSPSAPQLRVSPMAGDEMKRSATEPVLKRLDKLGEPSRAGSVPLPATRFSCSRAIHSNGRSSAPCGAEPLAKASEESGTQPRPNGAPLTESGVSLRASSVPLPVASTPRAARLDGRSSVPCREKPPARCSGEFGGLPRLNAPQTKLTPSIDFASKLFEDYSSVWSASPVWADRESTTPHIVAPTPSVELPAIAGSSVHANVACAFSSHLVLAAMGMPSRHADLKSKSCKSDIRLQHVYTKKLR